MASPQDEKPAAIQRSSSRSSVRKEKIDDDPEAQKLQVVDSQDNDEKASQSKYRPFILATLALLILGWWISATVLRVTRHRW